MNYQTPLQRSPSPPSHSIEMVHTVWTRFKLELATVGPVSSCCSGSDLEYICSVGLEATDGDICASCPQNGITCLLLLLWGKKNHVKIKSS